MVVGVGLHMPPIVGGYVHRRRHGPVWVRRPVARYLECRYSVLFGGNNSLSPLRIYKVCLIL